MMARQFGPFEEPSVSLSSSVGTNPPPHTSPSGLPPGSTRLVRLHPASVLHAPIQVSLFEINLSSCPDYECLSYTWDTGDTGLAAPKDVDVDGKTVTIRVNLFNAMCRLRLTDRERLLWVDALSIDQTNLEEKAQQVAMIGKIFQQSLRVLAWVGEHADNSELVFELSKMMQNPGGRSWLLEPRHYSQAKDMFDACSSFLDRKYFHRVWTFQEVVCHRDVLVCCGPDQKIWQDLIGDNIRFPQMGVFNDLFRSLDSVRGGLSREEAERWFSITRNVRDLLAARDSYVSGEVTPLGWIIWLRHRKCSDRRDRVYAVVSLIRDDAVEASVGTDYNISIPDLCYKVIMVTPKRNLISDGRLTALLDTLGCDHNETGHLIDLLLDRPDSATNNEWDWDVEDLVIHEYGLLTEYTEHCFDDFGGRRSHLLSWRTAARQRESWPQTPGKGVYPPFRRDCFSE